MRLDSFTLSTAPRHCRNVTSWRGNSVLTLPVFSADSIRRASAQTSACTSLRDVGVGGEGPRHVPCSAQPPQPLARAQRPMGVVLGPGGGEGAYRSGCTAKQPPTPKQGVSKCAGGGRGIDGAMCPVTPFVALQNGLPPKCQIGGQGGGRGGWGGWGGMGPARIPV